MKRMMIACVLAVFGSAAFAADVVSAGIGVMVTDNSDFGWQANVPDDGVITWRWDGATEATATVVSVLDGRTVSLTAVTKSGSEKYGSLTLPSASETEDALYDLTVALAGGETLTARVARPAARSKILSQTPDHKWRRVEPRERRIFAYDGAWFDGCEDATTACYTVDGVAYAVPAARGFGVLAGRMVTQAGAFPFGLAFDGETAFERSLRLAGGLLLFIR